FECGRVFHTSGEGQRLAIVLTGEHQESSWRGQTARSWVVFDLTGAVRQLASLPEQDIVPMSNPAAPFGACADVFLNGKKIGIVGQLTPAVAREIGASTPLLCAEFDLHLWRATVSTKTQVAALAKFPGSARDIAFVAPLALPYGEVRSLIDALKEPLLESTHLFDLFTDPKGEKIPPDKKSMAISLTFRSAERTLTADEVQAAADRIKGALREKLSVDFRDLCSRLNGAKSRTYVE
ncbi:MAG: hypothetical protein EBY32_11250, partial [Proteobacteria bacterium]|nr:hypothetical protein [Pseudomonadota bacterium]